MPSSKETIAAIATPAGRGGVGIVRVSGGEAEAILRRLVPEWPEEHESHKLRLSKIHDADGELVDESLAVYMEGPKTYTGEDVVEFQCHGGPIILRRVLDACLTCGARMAEPGEFTQRAFLNGRIDLTQAEAVADLVEATSKQAHEMALEHLQGELGGTIEAQLERVSEAVTLVEAAIDFAHEEHVYSIEHDEVGDRIDGTLEELRRMKNHFDEGRRQREGVRVVLLGPTNAGKSTLFNALHGSDRAIVTPVAGTTRDFLEEELHIDGVALRLADTAGLRDTEDQVESIGIERSREMKQKADLVIWVVDRHAGLDDEMQESLAETFEETNRGNFEAVVVVNKADLESDLTDEDWALIQKFEHVVETAVTENETKGVAALTDALGDIGARLTSGEGVLLSRARHLECVTDAIESLERAKRSLEAGMEHEIVALDLREALDSLGDIVGRVSTDDILNQIFSEFCVGK